MTNKPRLTAGQMAGIRRMSDDIRKELENRVSDFAMEIVTDNHPEYDLENDDEILIDLEIDYEGIIADMILQDIRREF